MKRFAGYLALVMCLAASAAVFGQGKDLVIESFNARGLPKAVEPNGVKARVVKAGGRKAPAFPKETEDGTRNRVLRLNSGDANRPGIAMEAEGTWDWTGYAGLALDVFNPGEEPMDVFLRVNSKGDDGHRWSYRGSMAAKAGELTMVRLYFDNDGLGPYWGMRGIPVLGPILLHGPGMGGGGKVELSKVTGIEVYVRRPEEPVELVLDNIRVFAHGSPLEHVVPMPFVDQFGQYIHDDWPGKVHSEEELVALQEKEKAAVADASFPKEFDQYGGWAAGPQLEATGWFRTEKVDGKWWLVTPEGHLFFSLGVTCIHWGNDTFVTGRKDWFEWIPEKDGPFKGAIGRRRGVHSMAETINEEGDTVNFYQINLMRGLGQDWRNEARELAYKRLKAWRFNTVANWSDYQVQRQSPLPFTVCGGTGGPPVEASEGFWGKLVDVFDPRFTEITERNLARLAKDWADNPRVIGFFVDNEMSWKAVALGVLASPPEQPAREVLIADLEAKYGAVEKVNEAWGTKASSWDALRAPDRPNDACRGDLDAYEYKFARKYFDTVKASLKKHAPNHLYLGCRFVIMYCTDPVMKACSEVVDVVSLNLYQPGVRQDAFEDVGKPYIIGEFHVGALDRGMFHQGLQSAADQNDRARKYVEYVQSVADSPYFVGCHWFQYFDQPNTGRFMDGENYNIGLVTIVNGSYKELTEAATRCNQNIYRYRLSQ